MIAALAVGVAAYFVAAWTAPRQSPVQPVALPALPDLTGQPSELRERLQRAHAAARQPNRPLESLAELGRLFHANGYVVEAEACWQTLAAEDPRNARWSYLIAELRRLDSDNPGQIAWLVRATERAPTYAPAWLRLADVQFKSGRIDAARQAYQKRLSLLPGDAYARLGLVRVALQERRRDEARSMLAELVRDWPAFSPAHNLLAEQLAIDGDLPGANRARVRGRDAGRFREAEDPWLDELIAWCFDYDRLCVRATVDSQTKYGDHGRATLERAIALKPDALAAYELLGGVYLESNDGENARRVYERGFAAAPAATPSAHYFVNLSRAYLLLQQPTAAVRVCREGLARLGDAYELYDALGAVLLEMGERDAAIAALRKAVQGSPIAANANYTLATALIGGGQLEEAVEALRRALAAEPTHPPTLALLAQIEIDSGRWLDAIKYLRPLYDAHPDLPEAREKMAYYYRHAGWTAEKAGDFTAAERHYRAGREIDPNDAELQVRLGVLCLTQRRFAEAVDPLEAYHRLQPREARGALYLGQVYAATGRRNEAKEILRKGIQLAEEAGNPGTAQHCRDILQRLP